MNDISSYEGVVFQNPQHKPLEDLKLLIKRNGITQSIPALDEHWVDKRCFLLYEPPNLIDSDGRDIIGAKERWLEVACFIIEDYNWLLQLPFYKFWSNMIYNPTIRKSLISFIQEAPTFCTLENFPNDYDIKEQFERIRKDVLIIFTRLVTNKESLIEYISMSKYIDLIYNKYLFTIPTLLDLCQHYGRDNRKIVEKIVNSIFSLQPLYKEDLEKAAAYIKEALRNIERRFEDCPTDQEGKAIPLSDRGGANVEITLLSLGDMILYLLDILSTVNIFLDIYPPAVQNFKDANITPKIVSVYSNAIPEMYKRLDNLAFNDESIEKYMELKHRLDVVRIQILNIYRTITYKNIRDIIENHDSSKSEEVGEIIEDFLGNLMHALSEKEFVIDYYNLYPVTDDFETLMNIHPQLDTVKCEFIVKSIFTFLDESVRSSTTKIRKMPAPMVESNVCNNKMIEEKNSVDGSSSKISNTATELASLISEVKDVLCNLGEGFIEKCLRHYNNKPESVINAVLEDSLPLELKSLDHALPFIPPDPEELLASVDAAIGIQRLNIYDNDEFDVMTKDVIDSSRIHKGKRKDKYKNLNELLNDKSHIAETKDVYNKYSIITSEYDDEYDDTYDEHDVGSSAQDDIVEVDARPFTIPRILRKREVNDYEEADEENDFDYVSSTKTNKDNFVQDPELLRAKAEERRLSKQGSRAFSSQNRNVVGNARGQGQTKEVTDNRNQKNKHKSSRANHNRRAGSQWKRNHGMVPS